MGFLKTLITDAANGVSLEMLPFFFLCLFVAGIYAYILVKSLPENEQNGIASFILPISMVLAFVSILVEHYQSVALVVLAAAVVTRLPHEVSLKQWAALILSLMFAVSAGIGHIILGAFAFAVIFPFYFIAVRKN
jgi:4-amino-4-deoxy-L-arabinose transferase-like glycosyltransferase